MIEGTAERIDPGADLAPRVLEELTAAYGLGRVRRLRALEGGQVNESYELRTDAGRYVVRRSREGRSFAAVEFEHSLMEYLSDHGFPVPPLLRTRDGESCHPVEGRPYRITGFVEGGPYSPEDARHLAAAARTLALYHRLVQGYDPGREKPGLRSILADLEEGLRLPWPPSGRPLADVSPALAECLACLGRQLLATCAWLVKSDAVPPRVVVHASCREGSFIFRGARVVAMLDYDLAHTDARTLDLGIALLSLAAVRPAKTRLDPAAALAFLRAYRQVAPISGDELALLPWYLRARILKRQIVRYEHALARPSPKREAKLLRAAAMLAWLDANESSLREACEA